MLISAARALARVRVAAPRARPARRPPLCVACAAALRGATETEVRHSLAATFSCALRLGACGASRRRRRPRRRNGRRSRRLRVHHIDAPRHLSAPPHVADARRVGPERLIRIREAAPYIAAEALVAVEPTPLGASGAGVRSLAVRSKHCTVAAFARVHRIWRPHRVRRKPRFNRFARDAGPNRRCLVRWDPVDPVPNRVDDGNVYNRLRGVAPERRR